jgi:nitroimidazol reductase NimA-like FMN-containing flavoprotein (pyridoxamine 5'-phosphate oxidase superfamily)
MTEALLFDKFEAEKRAQIVTLLDKPVLARLGTADPKTCQPHVVPLWYRWDGDNVWISGFGSTRKFRELVANPNCAILIEPADAKESKLQAVLFEGRAEIITEDREMIEQMSTQIYLRYLGEEGIEDLEPQSWIHDPQNLVVRLRPEKIFAW